MIPPRQQLDTVLQYLKNFPDTEFKILPLLKELQIPDDKDNIQSIVHNLEKHNHIIVADHRFELPTIKIKPEGIEFINRTSYSESEDVSDMGLDYFMSTADRLSAKDNKERLEIEHLQLQIGSLKNSLSDYSKIRIEAKTAIRIALVVALVEIVLLLKGLGIF
jgi:hypothetical protein